MWVQETKRSPIKSMKQKNEQHTYIKQTVLIWAQQTNFLMDLNIYKFIVSFCFLIF